MISTLSAGTLPYSCLIIGYMTMPPGFRYKDTFERGRPVHKKFDSFSLKHPPMDPGRRAKIFSPFAALEGFDERIAEKDIIYERQAELNESDKAELNRQLTILRDLTRNRRTANANHVIVSIRCFVPCTDPNHSAFGNGGQYETVTGIVLRVDQDRIILIIDSHEKNISFDVIREITCESNIFDQE